MKYKLESISHYCPIDIVEECTHHTRDHKSLVQAITNFKNGADKQDGILSEDQIMDYVKIFKSNPFTEVEAEKLYEDEDFIYITIKFDDKEHTYINLRKMTLIDRVNLGH